MRSCHDQAVAHTAGRDNTETHRGPRHRNTSLSCCYRPRHVLSLMNRCYHFSCKTFRSRIRNTTVHNENISLTRFSPFPSKRPILLDSLFFVVILFTHWRTQMHQLHQDLEKSEHEIVMSIAYYRIEHKILTVHDQYACNHSFLANRATLTRQF